MELSYQSIRQTILPSALQLNPVGECPPRTWDSSLTNPKNKLNSAGHVDNFHWRIDGCTNMGTQFYAIPVFITPLRPLRIDVFIPQIAEISPGLQQQLELQKAFSLRDARVANLTIGHYLVCVLSHWAEQHDDFPSFYRELPFGSRIVIENISPDFRLTGVNVIKTHFLERLFLSREALQAEWKGDVSSSPWPQTIDITNVHLLQQLHDSVSVIQIRGQKYILKALTSGPKYLYHELKVLLKLPPHPSIISRPEHLVTKVCKFGGKVAVIGFTLAYHEQGTLRDILSSQRTHNQLLLRDQYKWAIQLTDALRCIRDAGSFYCDLRLDNVVLSANGDAVMVDFEARGVALGASAPEVNYMEYISEIALAGNPGSEDYSAQVRERFKMLYAKMVGGRKVPRQSNKYVNTTHGYATPWLCLNESEREAAEVFMLGRVLWCIFEGEGSPEKMAMVQHIRENDLEFPAWRETPLGVRALIDRCIRFGERGYKKLPVVRKGDMLVLRAGSEVLGKTQTADEVRAGAKTWWEDELLFAEEYVEGRLNATVIEPEVGLPFGRPNLDEVFTELRLLAKLAGFVC